VAEPGFVTVARLEEVPPGTVRTVRAGDDEIAVVHCEDGIYATQSQCIHLRGPLGEGHLDGCLLSCPWHGWQYDVRTGENTFDLAIKLETYEVQLEDGEIRVRT
jgi:nitrite reductase (NADH) small subunit